MQLYTAEAGYNQILPQVMSKMTEAQNANYRSSEAKTLLQNATDAYNQAALLANQSQWQTAILDLQNASTLLDNASAKEQTYVAQQTLIEETIIIIVVGIVISAVLILRLKKRKSR